MEQQQQAARPGKKWELVGAIGVVGGFVIAQAGNVPAGAAAVAVGFVVFLVGRFK
jgi:hypothetical protein